MSSIPDFYNKQTIFLTGATGFLGKLMVEKILRASPDVQKIYILLRPKSSRSLEKRLNTMFEHKCFDVMKSINPNFASKIHVLEGDCCDPILGLNPQAQDILKKEVTCIFHLAANVRFDTDLKTAVYTNLRSVRDLLDLARQMENLKSFVYVSTAFSHCHRKDIDEEFYDVNIKPEKLLQLVDILDNRSLDILTPHLLGELPNTYVYTKGLAEDVIRTYKPELPLAIVRPSVVTSTSSEPVPGWIDNFHGVVGIIFGSCLGVIKIAQLNEALNVVVVPADFVVNIIMAAAWNIERSKDKLNQTKIPIYHLTNHKNNSVNWGWYVDEIAKYKFVYPLSTTVSYPYLLMTTVSSFYKIQEFFLHSLLGYLVDFVLLIVGKTTFAVKKYRQIHKLLDATSYFGTHSWNFGTQNAEDLWKKLNEKDKEMFNFNMAQINWTKYLNTCVKEGRLYLLNDPPETLPKAKKRMYLLTSIHYIFVSLIVYLLYCFFSLIVKMVF